MFASAIIWLNTIRRPYRKQGSGLCQECRCHYAGNLLKPMLGRGQLRCIGATTINEFRKYIEKDPALERRFQQVMVQEPSVPDTISILRGLRERCATWQREPRRR